MDYRSVILPSIITLVLIGFNVFLIREAWLMRGERKAVEEMNKRLKKIIDGS